MNILKRLALLTFAAILAVSVLVSCGDVDKGEVTPPANETKAPHTHKTDGEWQADKTNHWKLCADDGEKVDDGTHQLDNKGKCSVCGVGITETDGTTAVYFYNDKGNWVRCVNYTADGNTTEDKAEYEFFDDGNLKAMKIIRNGVVSYDAEYLVDEDGYNYEAKATQFFEDGTKLVSEYSNDGDITRETKVDKDGKSEYDYKYEYTYGDNGKKTNEKMYNGEKLIKEINYIVLFADSWGGGSYKLEVITYNDDGTKTVEYFTEDGEPYQE